MSYIDRQQEKLLASASAKIKYVPQNLQMWLILNTCFILLVNWLPND